MKVAFTLLALLGLATTSVSAKDTKPAVPVEDKLVVLEPMKIDGRPPISYAFDLTLYLDPATKKVNRIIILRVEANSDAERAGLKAGDEIVKLNGLPVKGMDSRVAPDSPLGRIFINRPPHERLDLEVIVRRTQSITLHSDNTPALEHLR